MSNDDQWLDLSLEGLPPAQADRIRVFRLLMLEGARLRGQLDKALAPSGVTAQQGTLLSWIQAQPEPPTFSAVAAGLAMTHQNVKQIALALQRKGLLDIQVDARDRRARRLVLTKQHHRFWRQRNPADFAAVQDWMAAWNDAEVRRVLLLLRRLHRHLDSQGD
ncbi:MAG: MarR family transcriptional regulator [Piscinibacter sp.]